MLITEKTFESTLDFQVIADFDAVDKCFYCGSKLTVPFVCWAGSDATMISLHPACAYRMGKALEKDYLKQTLDTKYKNGLYNVLYVISNIRYIHMIRNIKDILYIGLAILMVVICWIMPFLCSVLFFIWAIRKLFY